jgi:serine/threonine protein phosphatase PrpC
MMYRAFGKSHQGMVRESNEDALMLVIPDDGGHGLFAVADGVGGSRAGEVAAEMAVSSFKRQFLENHHRFAEYSPERDTELRGPLSSLVGGMVRTASAEIYERGRKDLATHGMGTTAVVLVTAGHGAFLGHVGDSRGYLVRGGQVYRLTEDHTFANYMLHSGVLDAESLKDHPFASFLSRTVGTAPHVDVDVTFIEVEPGDRFVLCTDGLHRYVAGQALKGFSDGAGNPKDLVERLVAEANGCGGADNVTVVAVESEGGTETMRTRALHEEIKLLKGTSLFERLTDQEIMRLMRIMYSQRHAAGEVIIHEDTQGQELFIVVEGAVDVSLRKRHLTTVSAGGHFGELALIDNQVRAATVTARSDVRLLTVNQKDFIAAIREDHALASKLLWSFLEDVAVKMRNLSREFVASSSRVTDGDDATLADFCAGSSPPPGPGKDGGS